MKKTLVIGILSLLSLSADYHEPSIGFNIDARYPFSTPKVSLNLEHQSAFDLHNGNIIILHGLSHPYSHKEYHHEVGVGYRKFYGNFGFGSNFVYANQNALGFFNHQFIPGVEVFYDHFTFVYNRYVPVKTGVEFKDNKYLFHDVSEITLSYRPSKKYEFCLTTNFNHQTKRVGYGGTISAFLFDNVKFTITPYCEPKVRNGVSFSFGYHFGGVTKLINQKLKKTHRFFFTSNRKEVEKLSDKATACLMPTPAPVILTPADYTKSGFVYEAPKAEQPNVVPKVQPKETPKEPSKSWWEWFGPAQTKP
jgi:hypothetical protein